MKNVLVLVMVLAFAASANAALMISINGNTQVDSIQIEPSDWITIDVHDDQAQGYVDWLAYLDIGPVADGDYQLANARLGAGAGDFASFVPSVYGGYDDFEITQADTATPNPDPGVVFEVDLHCLGVLPDGQVDVILYDSQGGVLDTATIYQVPEPATIALLGLGGLLLRRRRK